MLARAVPAEELVDADVLLRVGARGGATPGMPVDTRRVVRSGALAQAYLRVEGGAHVHHTTHACTRHDDEATMRFGLHRMGRVDTQRNTAAPPNVPENLRVVRGRDKQQALVVVVTRGVVERGLQGTEHELNAVPRRTGGVDELIRRGLDFGRDLPHRGTVMRPAGVLVPGAPQQVAGEVRGLEPVSLAQQVQHNAAGQEEPVPKLGHIVRPRHLQLLLGYSFAAALRHAVHEQQRRPHAPQVGREVDVDGAVRRVAVGAGWNTPLRPQTGAVVGRRFIQRGVQALQGGHQDG